METNNSTQETEKFANFKEFLVAAAAAHPLARLPPEGLDSMNGEQCVVDSSVGSLSGWLAGWLAGLLSFLPLCLDSTISAATRNSPFGRSVKAITLKVEPEPADPWRQSLPC